VNLAIFGGTFDPIHNAHLDVARAARRECFLDRILFIPAGQPPHKPGRCKAPYEHRFEMVKLACPAHPSFEASRLEAPGQDRGLPIYAIQTIRRVASHLTTHDRLFFLIGTDAFRELTTWYQWRHIVHDVEFIVVNRPGFQMDDSGVPPGARVHWLRSIHSPISSTEVRRRLRNGESLHGWLPGGVAHYIGKHQLYRPPQPSKRTAKRATRTRRPRRGSGVGGRGSGPQRQRAGPRRVVRRRRPARRSRRARR